MKKILLSITAVLFGMSIMAQGGTSLKLNLEKNRVYRLKSLSQQTISQTMNGVQQNTDVKASSMVSFKMMDASADFLIAEFRFDSLFTTTNAMGKVVNITSASEGNLKSADMGEVMSTIMNRLSKNPLYVKMDYSGRVLEIVNSKMLTEMLLKDTASITGETAAVAKMQIKGMTSDKALKTMVETFTHNLPGKEVSTGDKWDIKDIMNAGGMSLDITTSYSLEGISGTTASLTAESTIKAADDAEPLEYGPAKVSYGGLAGMGKSDVKLDTRTGLIIQNKSKSHIAGNLDISVQGMNLQMPMEMNGESEVVAVP